jgi:hypothetical protein
MNILLISLSKPYSPFLRRFREKDLNFFVLAIKVLPVSKTRHLARAFERVGSLRRRFIWLTLLVVVVVVVVVVTLVVAVELTVAVAS